MNLLKQWEVEPQCWLHHAGSLALPSGAFGLIVASMTFDWRWPQRPTQPGGRWNSLGPLDPKAAQVERFACLGHLTPGHDLPWWWADANDDDTIDIAGLPPVEHKVKIEFVDTNHRFSLDNPRQMTFKVPDHHSAKAHSKALQ